MASDTGGLRSIDQNLATIRTVESGWGLPSLPGDVSLDMATAGFSPNILTDFLTGLAEDIQVAQTPSPMPVRKADLWTPTEGIVGPENYTNRQNIARLLSGVVGQDPPQVYNENAIIRWRQRAVDRGLLDVPQAQLMDPRVRPEDRAVFGEMARQDMQDRYSGAEPGSVPMNRVWEMVDEWLSPRGLYRAAVNLDLFWDAPEIMNEFSEWGEKYQHLRENLDSPKAWIDALTGPIDDILFPAVNLALMFTGIGEVYATGKALFIAGRGVRGVRAVIGAMPETVEGASYAARHGLGAFKAADRAADLQRLAEPSWMARKLAGGADITKALEAGDEVNVLSRSMAGWRNTKSVAMAKKANQQVLRAGFMSNAQALINDNAGNMSIGSQVPGLNESLYAVMSHPLIDFGGDLLLYPNNIFEPGSVKRGVQAVGTAADKVAAAAGFERIADEQKLVAAWYRPVEDYVRREHGEKAARAMAKRARKVGVAEAAMEAMNVPAVGKEEVGQALFDITVTAAVSGAAKKASRDMKGVQTTLVDVPADVRADYAHLLAQYKAQLSLFDDVDIEDAVDALGTFGGQTSPNEAGEWVEDLVQTGLRGSGKEVAQRRSLTREALYETAEQTAARGSEVGDGYVRLYGKRDFQTGRIEWSGNRWDDVADNYVVDVDLREVAELGGRGAGGSAAVFENAQQWGDTYARRFRGAVESTIGTYRRYDPDKVLNFKKLIRGHNEKRSIVLRNMLEQVDMDYLETYIADVLPQINNYADHLASTQAIEDMRRVGMLDDAKLAPAKDEYGNRINMFDTPDREKKIGDEVAEIITADALNDSSAAEAAAKAWAGPLVRDMDPGQFKFSATRLETRTKQEAVSMARRAERIVNLKRNVKALRQMGVWDGVVDSLDEALVGTQGVLGELPRAAGDLKWSRRQRSEAISRVLADRNLGMSNRKARSFLNDLLRYVQDTNDVSTLRNLDEALDAKVADMIADAEWGRYNVPSHHGQKLQGAERLAEMAKEVRRQSNWIAAEVENVPKELAEELARRGYKLTYGAMFQHPHHLQDVMPEIAAIKRKQLSRLNLEQFFSRQKVTDVARVKAANMKAALTAEFANGRVKDSKLNLGSPQNETPDLEQVLNDVWDIHNDVLAKAQDPTGGVLRKVGTRIANSRMPYSPERLASDMHFGDFVKAFRQKGYTEAEAKAIFRALQRSQKLGFRRYGLFNIEATLRSRPLVADSLNLFGHVDLGGALARTPKSELGGVRRVMRNATEYGGIQAVGGSIAGYQVGEEYGGPGGAFAGLFAGGALGAGARKLMTPGVQRVADAAMNSNKLKWMYVPDNLANLRDTFRFTLSPIFDASRYTEAIFLSQFGELPEGATHLLRMNQSPRAARRHIAKQWLADHPGATKAQAAEKAAQRWDEVRDEFFAAARGDFAMEAVDSVNRRLSSQGMLGFSPTEWMSATYYNLTSQGVDARDAYEAVRNTYTYGTDLRSPAELSMNFVFFPFSFTKKVLTHMGSFFAQDLGRLILIQDGVATYNMLNEHYNLSEQWRDRLPILENMNRLNVLAYGISPGRFGGVNAPFIESAVGSGLGDMIRGGLPGEQTGEVDEILNLFVPNMVTIRNEDDGESLIRTIQKALPAINDIESLTTDALRQAQVFDGDLNFVTDEAEARKGWDAWREFQNDASKTFAQAGYTWDQAQRDPVANAYIKQKRAEISALYPAWRTQMGEYVGYSISRDLEKNERLFGGDRTDTADQGLYVFENTFREVGEALRSRNYSYESPEELPPDVVLYLRRQAIAAAKEYDGFERLYRRFYRHVLGDITEELV